jgi:hypothetical protein
MDTSSHGSFGQSETTVSILMSHMGRMGGDDICGRDAKVLHGMIWSAIWGTFMLSCGLASSIYVESRFFQFVFLLSLTPLLPLLVILNGVIASMLLLIRDAPTLCLCFLSCHDSWKSSKANVPRDTFS